MGALLMDQWEKKNEVVRVLSWNAFGSGATSLFKESKWAY